MSAHWELTSARIPIGPTLHHHTNRRDRFVDPARAQQLVRAIRHIRATEAKEHRIPARAGKVVYGQERAFRLNLGVAEHKLVETLQGELLAHVQRGVDHRQRLQTFTQLGAGYPLIVPYIVMIIGLLVRPYGLFGTPEIRRV